MQEDPKVKAEIRVGEGQASNLVLAILFPVMFAAVYLHRISVEERMLGQELDEDYAEYRQRTRKLLPCLY
jgi:protein-S-isoprenylcysteine O-methyltransferase Ste14